MEVIVRPTTNGAINLTAALIDHAVRASPDITLGLATGRTMEALYKQLAMLCTTQGLDFSLARSFNLDEYIGLPHGSKYNYRHYMNEHFFKRINIDLKNTHLPDGAAADIEAECTRYEQQIQACGGIDIQLLGIGRSGHIGFNEPISSLASRTRAKSLVPETIAQNAPLFDDPSEMPRRAITMGVGTIMDARRVLLLVTGAEKAAILAKAVEGPVTSMVTASALQFHPRCTVIADQAAAAHLEGRAYYDFVFNTEPEWEPYRHLV